MRREKGKHPDKDNDESEDWKNNYALDDEEKDEWLEDKYPSHEEEK